MKRLLFMLAGVAFCLNAHASSIAVANLPVAIQSCISGGQCSVDTASSFDQSVPGSGGISAYHWYDLRSGSTESKYLIRYSLASGSNSTHIGLDSSGNPLPAQTTPISGNLWLGVNDSYAISGSDLSSQYATMSLFWDQTTPGNFTSLANGEQTIRMNMADLLAGSAFSSSQCCSSGGTTTGSLQGLDFGSWQGALPCVADGCSTGAQLSLIDLSFVNAGPMAALTFDSTDPRSVLYQLTTDDPYSDGFRQFAYAVRPVPAPASALLLGLGLLALATTRIRPRHAN